MKLPIINNLYWLCYRELKSFWWADFGCSMFIYWEEISYLPFRFKNSNNLIQLLAIISKFLKMSQYYFKLNAELNK